MSDDIIIKALKTGVKDTVEHLIKALNEDGVVGCISLLIEMERMLKTGEFDSVLKTILEDA